MRRVKTHFAGIKEAMCFWFYVITEDGYCRIFLNEYDTTRRVASLVFPVAVSGGLLQPRFQQLGRRKADLRVVKNHDLISEFVPLSSSLVPLFPTPHPFPIIHFPSNLLPVHALSRSRSSSTVSE